jgi:hypothetical protein
MRAILALCDVPEVGCLPLGCVVGMVRLEGCFQFGTLAHEEWRESHIDGLEEAMGNHAPGRWGWLLSHPRVAEPGLTSKGALGLWRWTPPPYAGWHSDPWVVNCATPGCASRCSVGIRARTWPGGRCPLCAQSALPPPTPQLPGLAIHERHVSMRVIR